MGSVRNGDEKPVSDHTPRNAPGPGTKESEVLCAARLGLEEDRATRAPGLIGSHGNHRARRNVRARYGTGSAAAAFEAIVADVYEPLQRYLRRRAATEDLDDLLNDALLTIWRRLDDVPRYAVLPWSYGVAHRVLANHRRGASRRRHLDERLRSGTPPVEPHGWTNALDLSLHEAVQRLSDLDREVVRLWAWEQLEPREIADALGVTPNAVSARLTRIHYRLRGELARQDHAAAGHEDHGAHSELEP